MDIADTSQVLIAKDRDGSHHYYRIKAADIPKANKLMETDDIVRGMEPGTLSDLMACPFESKWVYSTHATNTLEHNCARRVVAHLGPLKRRTGNGNSTI